jgi:hypothetical protein
VGPAILVRPRPPEGTAADSAGDISGVEVTETDVKLYVKK